MPKLKTAEFSCHKGLSHKAICVCVLLSTMPDLVCVASYFFSRVFSLSLLFIRLMFLLLQLLLYSVCVSVSFTVCIFSSFMGAVWLFHSMLSFVSMIHRDQLVLLLLFSFYSPLRISLSLHFCLFPVVSTSLSMACVCLFFILHSPEPLLCAFNGFCR